MSKEAYRFIIPLLVGVMVCLALGAKVVGFLLATSLLFIAYFFRDPERAVPSAANLIVSPADGRVVEISSDGKNNGFMRLSIFLSLFDVHINRAPISGRIAAAEYRCGKFKPAFNSVASKENEQNVLTIRNSHHSITMTQIAGVIARRIICWKKLGDEVNRGERIGMIRFGSRVNLLLPLTVELKTKVGDKVKAGESIIGVYRDR